jgi:hypothetical protein
MDKSFFITRNESNKKLENVLLLETKHLLRDMLDSLTEPQQNALIGYRINENDEIVSFDNNIILINPNNGDEELYNYTFESFNQHEADQLIDFILFNILK